MSLQSVLKEELAVISLSREEVLRLEKVAKDFIASLKAKGIKAHVGGSLAKGTMVNREGKQDIDIFVVFDYSEDILGLEKVFGKIKLPGDLKKVHGSRDYFQIICDNDENKQFMEINDSSKALDYLYERGLHYVFAAKASHGRIIEKIKDAGSNGNTWGEIILDTPDYIIFNIKSDTVRPLVKTVKQGRVWNIDELDDDAKSISF